MLAMESQLLESDIIFLLQKYIENRCSEGELRTLLHWLKSPDSREEFDLVGQSAWIHFDKNISYPEDDKIATLSKEVSHLLQHIKQEKTAVSPILSVNPAKWLYRIAAAILFLFVLGTGYYLIRSGQKNLISYKEIVVSRGEVKEYTLDDGTSLILNSGSRLIIPSNYNKGHREIEMTGEIFFDVMPDPNKPFIIKNNNTRIKVLGTSFNLKSYKEDASMELTVSTGKVLIDIPDMDIRLRVNPLEHLSINKQAETLEKLKLDENYYAKWVGGMLYFDKTPIDEAIKTINLKYNKTILLSSPDYDNLISGIHDNKNLDAIVESICFATGLKQRAEGDTIILFK